MSRIKVRYFLLILTLATLAACQGRCGRKPPQNQPEVAGSTGSVFAAGPVSYCRERSVAPQARVQLLIDASGSMRGFKNSMPTLASWVEHAVSELRGSSLELASERTCLFNQRDGIFGCVPALALPDYQPASDTNLHKAIRTALSNDLTFVVTDGVAATGTEGDSDCATGVDAACVARALSETVSPPVSGGEGAGLPDKDGGSADAGIWILPLVTSFDGTFYSEEVVSPQDFDPQATMAEINSRLDRQDTVVGKGTSGTDSRLNFYYKGPKALLLIVIARQQKLGRDAVWSLWNQESFRNVTRLADMKDFSRGLGSLAPLEVYPGFLNRIRFESLKPTDEPSEHRGTLDVAFVPGEPRSSIRLDCPPNDSGEGVYILKGSRRDRQQSSTCVPIQQLPAYSLQLEPARGESDLSALETLIRGYQREGSEEALRLDLACGAGPRRPCESQPVPVRWNDLRDYARTAAALAAAEKSGIALTSVLDTSTVQAHREPHRIYGLAATLQSFYDLVAEDARRLPLAELDICNGSAR